jgi:hypothetical protein
MKGSFFFSEATAEESRLRRLICTVGFSKTVGTMNWSLDEEHTGDGFVGLIGLHMVEKVGVAWWQGYVCCVLRENHEHKQMKML